MHLCIDAFNLTADRRGMGRYVRSVLRGIDSLGSARVTLIARNRIQAEALAGEFAYPVLQPRELRRRPHDAVWYAWNGMRFQPHAPCAATIYDPFAFTQPHPNIVARWREQAPIRRSLQKADALLTISAWTARELRTRFAIPAERITVAPPIVDAFWHPADAPARDSYVLLVAGPEPRKNVAVFADAFQTAFPDGSVTLAIAGNVAPRDEHVLANLQIPIERLQPDDHRLRELYSGATAVAIPSSAEGYGIVAIEAMACGAPVIAADAAALPEACGDAALLIPPGDRDAWCDALRSVVKNSDLRADLRSRGLERVALMDPLAPARTLLEVLQRLVAED